MNSSQQNGKVMVKRNVDINDDNDDSLLEDVQDKRLFFFRKIREENINKLVYTDEHSNRTLKSLLEDISTECNVEDENMTDISFRNEYVTQTDLFRKHDKTPADDCIENDCGYSYDNYNCYFSCIGIGLPCELTKCLNSSLTCMDVSRSDIVKIHDRAFSGLSCLVLLDLSRNRIQTLNSDIFNGLSDLSELDLSRNKIKTIDNYVFNELSDLTNLDLSQNRISTIDNYAFNGLSNLCRLNLSHNEITVISEYAFDNFFGGILPLNLPNLLKLDLSKNDLSSYYQITYACRELHGFPSMLIPDFAFSGFLRLEFLDMSNYHVLYLPDKIFTGLSNLLELRLSYNDIATLPIEVFVGLSDLVSLNVSNNKISFLPDNVFNDLCNLTLLDLSHNRILSLTRKVFNRLSSLRNLDLSYNMIPSVPGNAFKGLFSLANLNLSNNKITAITTKTFRRIVSLMHLDISYNKLSLIPTGSFKRSGKVKCLNIIGNPLNVREDMFEGLNNLEILLTNTPFSCCVKPKSVADNKCLSTLCLSSSCEVHFDAMSSCQTLIRSKILRIFLWIIGICAVVGNFLVIFYRTIIDRENMSKNFSVFVLNLAISDFLMGVYLMVIGAVDAHYQGVYALNAMKWRESLLCTSAGVLSTVSSEMSTFLVLLVTLHRLIVIVFPLSRYTLQKSTWRLATFVSLVMWVVSITIAIVPTISVQSYFKGGFYSQSSVCLALPLTAHKKIGAEYSAAVFIGLNSLIFITILVGQVTIFVCLRKRPNISKRPNQKEDKTIARTLFLVVATDFCCWFPIGVMGITALSGTQLSDEVYAWVMVFVLPVNAGVNPFLYTMTYIWRRKRSLPMAVR
ncbi:relaxin receptor 1-like [Ylistrum balloti]|uniref:relaxin receptor 1-like n=1 Tax=Ylistrum balloti TaxID=509963 RepID=UPI002905987F|nr:relaxin receptor 1-like [Ylistrum balloti]